MSDDTQALYNSLADQLKTVAPIWLPRIKTAIESLAYFGDPIDDAILPSFSGKEPTEPHKIETVYGFTHLYEPDAVSRLFIQYRPEICAARAFARKLPEFGEHDYLGGRFRWQHEPTATIVLNDCQVFKVGIALSVSMTILCPSVAMKKAA